MLAARRGVGEVSFGRSKGREQRPLPVPGVGGLPVGGHGVATVPGERAGEGGRAGEPLAALGLIENRNMLKFSFVLGWGLGNTLFSVHF